MVIQTKTVQSDNGGDAHVDVVYQDAGQRQVLQLKVYNLGPEGYYVRLSNNDDSLVVENTYGPRPGGEAHDRVLTAGEANQMGITITAKGTPIGFNVRSTYPSPFPVTVP